MVVCLNACTSVLMHRRTERPRGTDAQEDAKDFGWKWKKVLHKLAEV